MKILTQVRLLQLLGLCLALVGLIGFWLNRDVQRVELSTEQKELINLSPNTFHASFVIAGRDYDHIQEASPCQWRAGVCYRERTGKFVYAKRTDTILYVQIIGNKVTMINLPRDLYLPQWETKINAMYFYQGAEGLKRTVEEIVGVPIDYYAIINIDIFKDLVDALGGVEVTIPQYGNLNGMHYRDAAAGLEINFDPGPRLLDGEDAAKFVRFRSTPRGDLDRIDNLKTLAISMLKRLRELHVAAAVKMPALVDALFKNLETNATPALLKELLPYITKLELQPATLPYYTLEGRPNDLLVDVEDVARFMAQTFGGVSKEFVLMPEIRLLITNRSDIEGLAESYRERLVAMGFPEASILTQDDVLDLSPTRLLTTFRHWQDADYFMSLFQVGKVQVDHLSTGGIDLELILGRDAIAPTMTSSMLSQR